MARQSFTLDDLRSDSTLLDLFKNNFGGNSSIFGATDEYGNPTQSLEDWYNSLPDNINYGIRSGDNQGTQYNYVRQPDGSFAFQDTSTFYRPSSWVNFRDEVGIPTAAATAAMVGLQGLGAGGYLGADVAASTAAQGGFLGTGAGGAFGPSPNAPTGGSGITPGTGTTGLQATPAPGGLETGLATPTTSGAGLTPPVVNPIGSNIGTTIIPNPVSPDILNGGGPFAPPVPGTSTPTPTPGTNPGGPVGSPGGPGGQTQNPGGRNNMGNVLGALFGMHTAEEQRKRYDELMGKLDELYRPDSAYAMQMQDELARRDSAAGRGSQYGPRSVELAAKLTDSRREALGQMALPIVGMGVTQNLVADNLNNLFTGKNGNIWDAASNAWDWGQDAWDWFSSRIPGLIGD